MSVSWNIKDTEEKMPLSLDGYVLKQTSRWNHPALKWFETPAR